METGHHRYTGSAAGQGQHHGSYRRELLRLAGSSGSPSSLNLSIAGNTVKLDWEVHGGGPTGIVVERKTDGAGSLKETWNRIAKLSPLRPNTVTPV